MVVKDQLTERYLVAACIAIFGAVTYVFNRIAYARTWSIIMTNVEISSRLLNAIFSGLMFGLLVLAYGEIIGHPISNVFLWLAVGFGSVSGGAGLKQLGAAVQKLLVLQLRR